MGLPSSSNSITAFCDGGSRGNPGPAAYGVFIQSEGGAPLASLSEFLGVKTNNVAEYAGLLAALSWALDNKAQELRVISDSELMVKQIRGQYSVKSPDLKPLYEEAKRRIAKLTRFEMQHVLRGKNKEADRLANEAMDRGMGRAPARVSHPAQPGPMPRPASEGRPETSAPRLTTKSAVPEREITGFVKNGVVHLVEGHLPEGAFVRILPARR